MLIDILTGPLSRAFADLFIFNTEICSNSFSGIGAIGEHSCITCVVYIVFVVLDLIDTSRSDNTIEHSYKSAISIHYKMCFCWLSAKIDQLIFEPEQFIFKLIVVLHPYVPLIALSA